MKLEKIIKEMGKTGTRFAIVGCKYLGRVGI